MWTKEPEHNDLQEIMEYSPTKSAELLQIWCQELQLPEDTQVFPSIWEDSGIRPWISDHVPSQGGKAVAWTILQHPTADVKTLQERQAILKSYDHHDILSKFYDLEPDFLWLFSVPAITDSPSLQLLFPTFFALRFMNHIPRLLAFFHIYKGYIAPLMNFTTPIGTILGPYFFLRRSFGKSITFRTYIRMFCALAKRMFQPSGMIQKDLSKLGSVGLYVILFIIGTVQSLDIAKNVRQLRATMLHRVHRIREFVATNLEKVSAIPANVWKVFGLDDTNTIVSSLPSDLTFLYLCITNGSFRDQLATFLKKIYILDSCQSIRSCFANGVRGSVCMVKYTAGPTRFWAMGHIRLDASQVRNPCDVSNNLIITGPNAGGKTTYVKALCANMLLSQTFGFAIAQKAVVQPVYAFGSFMRTTDVLGHVSLFEAEAKRCAELIQHAQRMSQQGLRALYFLDEPMNSTPPVEGACTTLAAVEYLGNLPGIRVVVTTHFHQITELGKQPNFKNLSMEAIHNPDGTFKFPYTIRKGASYQCIALELLRGSNIPNELITRAIKWKNKICDRQVK